MTEPSYPKPAAVEGPDYDRAFRRLCHLAALTREGRLPAAVERLILTVLAFDADAQKGQVAVRDAIRGYFGLVLASTQVDLAIDHLAARGEITIAPDGSIAPSEISKIEIQRRTTEAQRVEAQVRGEWLGLVREELSLETMNDDQLWRGLLRFMADVFNRHGVETIALLQPADSVTPALARFERALQRAASEVGIKDVLGLRRSFELFFNRRTDAKTAYLVQLLDATFTFYALTVDDATASYLRDALPPLRVFLDTNFIFGLLDLHDNP